MVIKRKKRYTLTDVLIALALLFCGLLCLVPIWNTVAISFSDRTSAAMGQVGFIPVNFNLSSYKAMMEERQFGQSFWVSVQRVVLGASINMIVSILMAYPLSKSPQVFHAKKVYMWFTVFTMMFTGGLVPTFMVVRYLGLMDSLWALVLPTAVPVFNVIILMNFFKGIPRSLEEAAFVDGAGPWYILWHIYVPLSKASLATIALFAIVNHWNSFFDGKIYINSVSKLPLQTYIQSLSATLDPTQMATMSAEEIKEKLAMSSLTFNSAKVIVSMVPILLIYPFLQKYFVTGIVVGAVKE